MNYVILYLKGASVVKFWSAQYMSTVLLKALGDLEGDSEQIGEFRQALVEVLEHPAGYSKCAITTIVSTNCRPESCLDTSLVLLIF